MKMIAALAAALPAIAGAEPCVGPNFDRDLPGAVSVERRSSDVPTARYPGIWQEGRIAGFAYQIASDYSAVLSDSHDAPSWQIAVLCSPDEGASCDRTTAGAPDPAAGAIADALTRCLMGEAVTAADFTRPDPATISGLPAETGVPDPERNLDSVAAIATAAGAQRAAELATSQPAAPTPSGTDQDPDRPAAITATPDQAPPAETARQNDLGPSILPDAPCGLQLIEPGNSTVQTLQRLLARAGQQPGPDDGVMGNRTRDALIAELGPQAAALSTEDAIRALNESMCQE